MAESTPSLERRRDQPHPSLRPEAMIPCSEGQASGAGSVARALELSLLLWGKEVVMVFPVLGTQSDQMSQGNEAIESGWAWGPDPGLVTWGELL